MGPRYRDKQTCKPGTSSFVSIQFLLQTNEDDPNQQLMSVIN
jgi:hypothetical protein